MYIHTIDYIQIDVYIYIYVSMFHPGKMICLSFFEGFKRWIYLAEPCAEVSG